MLKSIITKTHSTGASAAKIKAIDEEIGTCMHPFTSILYDIRTILGEQEVTYLEIGSYRGNSACLMLSHDFPTRVIGIDACTLNFKDGAQADVIHANVKHFGGEGRFELRQGFSTNPSIIDGLKRDGVAVDILFIDGGHDFKTVVADWKNYEPFVKPGGFIVFDDYNDLVHSPQVKPAVDSVVSSLEEGKMEIVGCIDNVLNLKVAPNVKYPNKGLCNDFILRKIK